MGLDDFDVVLGGFGLFWVGEWQGTDAKDAKDAKQNLLQIYSTVPRIPPGLRWCIVMLDNFGYLGM